MTVLWADIISTVRNLVKAPLIGLCIKMFVWMQVWGVRVEAAGFLPGRQTGDEWSPSFAAGSNCLSHCTIVLHSEEDPVFDSVPDCMHIRWQLRHNNINCLLSHPVTFIPWCISPQHKKEIQKSLLSARNALVCRALNEHQHFLHLLVPSHAPVMSNYI